MSDGIGVLELLVLTKQEMTILRCRREAGDEHLHHTKPNIMQKLPSSQEFVRSLPAGRSKPAQARQTSEAQKHAARCSTLQNIAGEEDQDHGKEEEETATTRRRRALSRSSSFSLSHRSSFRVFGARWHRRRLRLLACSILRVLRCFPTPHSTRSTLLRVGKASLANPTLIAPARTRDACSRAASYLPQPHSLAPATRLPGRASRSIGEMLTLRKRTFELGALASMRRRRGAFSACCQLKVKMALNLYIKSCW